MKEASVLFDAMSLRHSAEDLRAYLPERVRDNIIVRFSKTAFGLRSLLGQNPERNINKLQQALNFQKFFNVDQDDLIRTRFALFRACDFIADKRLRCRSSSWRMTSASETSRRGRKWESNSSMSAQDSSG